jgi:hypothetical protein
MRKLSVWLLCGLAMDAAIALAVRGYWLPSGASQTLAAWIQAFGSIAAIGIAYLVGAKQSRAAIEAVNETQRSALEDRRRGHFAVADAAYEVAAELWAVMQSESPRERLPFVYVPVVTQRLTKSLDRIPVHEVGSANGVAGVLSLVTQFGLLEVALERYLAGPFKDPEIQRHLAQYSEAHDNKVRDQIRDGADKAFAHNVRVHLKRIAVDYEAVRLAMGQPHSTRAGAGIPTS